MLGFGSKSAPMAKVLDFGTKKNSKGGFSERGDQKTINFENQNVSRSRFSENLPPPDRGMRPLLD